MLNLSRFTPRPTGPTAPPSKDATPAAPSNGASPTAPPSNVVSPTAPPSNVVSPTAPPSNDASPTTPPSNDARQSKEKVDPKTQAIRDEAATQLGKQLGIFTAYCRRLDHLLEHTSAPSDVADNAAFKKLRNNWAQEMEAAGRACNAVQKNWSGWNGHWGNTLWLCIGKWSRRMVPPTDGFNLEDICKDCGDINDQSPPRDYVDVKAFRSELRRRLSNAYPDLYAKDGESKSPKNEHERLKSDITFLLAIAGFVEVEEDLEEDTKRKFLRSARPWLAAPVAQLIHRVIGGGEAQIQGVQPAQAAQIRLTMSVTNTKALMKQGTDSSVRRTLAFFLLVRKLYEKHVRTLESPMQDAVDQIDDEIADLIRGGNKQWRVLLRRRQEIVLCLREWPTKSIPPMPCAGDRNAEMDVNTRVSASWYAHRNLRHILSPMQLNSVEPKGLLLYYLHGASGVGKTQFCIDLANTFGLPGCSPDLNETDLPSFFKQPSQDLESWSDPRPRVLSGAAWSKHFDALVAFLEPAQQIQQISIAGSAVNFDISAVTVFFTSTESLQNERLKSRLTLVHFPPLSPEAKAKALHRFLEEEKKRVTKKLDETLLNGVHARLRGLVESLSTRELCKEAGLRRLLWVFRHPLWGHALKAEQQRAGKHDRDKIDEIEKEFRDAVVDTMTTEFNESGEDEMKQYSVRVHKAIAKGIVQSTLDQKRSANVAAALRARRGTQRLPKLAWFNEQRHQKLNKPVEEDVIMRAVIHSSTIISLVHSLHSRHKDSSA
ncbi:P-loop containing nucleoside triphosphate hydrolase [Ceraceosorus bombacis]|uniref:p-loop containing nucleoside triphosphate hydrolase n=1 Tax=Ceraceosorus bombacis TaxID=401625 RepID=A0A0N7L9U3_9BASI|nr:P-loop containing nucleoside triphosphate hydrolase [Ceraceosorus bombacis]